MGCGKTLRRTKSRGSAVPDKLVSRMMRMADRFPIGTCAEVACWTGQEAASINPALAALFPCGPGAQVAQLVEHVTENHGVGGSIPPLGTTSLFLDVR
jgi:hypothetical protein